MALNFSYRPVFPGHVSEDTLVSPMRIANGYLVEGVPERNGDGFGRPWHSNRQVEDFFDRCDRGGLHDPISNDILDLLPSDPFGMDISTTFTAISGWLEDLEVDYGGYGNHHVGTSNSNYELFAGLNFIWNNAMRFHAFPGNIGVDHKSNVANGFAGYSKEKGVGDASCHGGFGSACAVADILNFGSESCGVSSQKNVELQDGNGILTDEDGNGDGGTPHCAFMFALGYLGVRDLFVVEKVCRSLRSSVHDDPLLWRSIHIDQPLNEKITDDILLQLTNRAQGSLQCLSLVECSKITDDGLKRVLESNLRLIKLSVPGCTKLSIEGIVNNLKAFKSKGAQNLKHLRIGGRYGVTQQHFEELKFLLLTDSQMQQNPRKPHFYHRGNFYLPSDDDSDIDIEMCPRCQNPRLVYDCPAEACQGKKHPTQVCRACTLCIGRCVQCGRCITDDEYEETFCLEKLCSDCGKQGRKSQERQDRKYGPSESVILHEENYGVGQTWLDTVVL